MPSEKFQKRRALLAIIFFSVISSVSTAQEPAKRVPAEALKPEYAGMLLAESRERLEQPDKILQVMGLKDGDIVADIGCGNGFYTLRLAKKVGPHGIVLAVDVQQGMLDQLAERQKEAHISNIYPILGEYEDPLLPPGKVDWILLVDAYHEFSDPEAMLARMKESLAPGGRVALLEYRGEQYSGQNSSSIMSQHSMTIETVVAEWSPAGFELVTHLDFLPMQHFFIFKNANDRTRPAIRAFPVDDTQNVTTFDNRVYIAGQPNEEALKQFAEFGVKTVVNLRSDLEMASLGFDEKEVVEKAGMTYIHAPMGFEIPDAPMQQEIMSALDKADDSPVLIHCLNSNRAGVIWAIYAGRHDGLSVDEAVAEGKAAGMSLSILEKTVRDALSKQ